MSAGLGTRPSATTFDVEDLVTKAWNGTIRIPHFQRGFRWTRQDVSLLFDSIVRGYPVGSLLLWVRPAPAQTVHLGPFTTDAPSLEQALWVVDGQQRIVSLANALHPTRPADQRFALAYDLDEARFVPQLHAESAGTIPLPVLFNLQLLIRWFSEHPELADRLDEASALTRTIRQFEIPAYLVEQDDSTVLPVIFDRLNYAGHSLRRAEVFSALFAPGESGQDTRLTITGIAEGIDADLGFGQLDDETVLRAVLARRGPDVTRDIRSEFDADRRDASDFPDETRDEAVEAGRDALVRAVRFLQDEVGVPHLAFLAYRYLLVVLTRLFAHHPHPDRRNVQLLRRWYWRAALADPRSIRGNLPKSTTWILCSRVRPGDLSSSVQDLLAAIDSGECRLPDTADFHINDAAGKIALCALWSMEPRSPRTGKPYDRWQLASVLSGRATATDALADVIPPRLLPADRHRWIANRVLLADPDDLRPGEVDALFAAPAADADDASWLAVLRSHCMTQEVARLLDGNPTGFLEARQEITSTEVQKFVERMCEWGFEDTPPLQTLVMDNIDGDEDDLDEPR